jgi:hypothetical protein
MSAFDLGLVDGMEKVAFGFGAGVNVGKWKGLDVNVGFPYGVALSVPLMKEQDGFTPGVGIGLLGPQISMSYRKKKKSKDKRNT